METAKQTKIKVEVDNLDGAFKAYKEKYGSYPPCDLYLGPSDPTLNPNPPVQYRVLRAHIARAFPRYNLANLYKDLKATGLDLSIASRPDQALVFWLKGFSSDVSNPFVTSNGQQIINGAIPSPNTKVALTPLYTFDATRLVNLNKPAGPAFYPSYIPPGLKQNIPYVYFDPSWLENVSPPRNWDTSNAFDPAKNSLITTAGLAVPYMRDPNGVPGDGDEEMINAESVQIVACGLDHKFGAARHGDAQSLQILSRGRRLRSARHGRRQRHQLLRRARIGDDKP